MATYWVIGSACKLGGSAVIHAYITEAPCPTGAANAMHEWTKKYPEAEGWQHIVKVAELSKGELEALSDYLRQGNEISDIL